MGFMGSYKHLEKLCGEIYGEDGRVKAYIEEMKKRTDGSLYVDGWNNDLERLKRYKRIRNEISHTPGCDESNMSEPGAAEWLENFCSRILNRTDPLAVYSKKTEARQRSVKPTQTYGKTPDTRTYQNPYSYQMPHYDANPHERRYGCLVFSAVLLAAVIVIMLLMKETIISYFA